MAHKHPEYHSSIMTLLTAITIPIGTNVIGHLVHHMTEMRI